jgi:hypothetical protein
VVGKTSDVLTDDRILLGVVDDGEVGELHARKRAHGVHQPHVVGGGDVIRVELPRLEQGGIRLVFFAGAGVEQPQPVECLGHPGGALDGDLVLGPGTGVLPHLGQLVGHFEVGAGVVVADVDLIDLGQCLFHFVVVQPQGLDGGEQAERFDALGLGRNDPLDWLQGQARLVLPKQAARLQHVGINGVLVDLAQCLDAAVNLGEVVSRQHDFAEQAQRVRVLRVGIEDGLEFAQRLFLVVVREVILRRRFVGGPVGRVDFSGAQEDVEDHLGQGVVVGVFPVEDGPAVDGPSEIDDVASAVERAAGARAAVLAGLPLAEDVLRGIDEPGVLRPCRVQVAHLLADRAEQVVSAPGIRVGLHDLVQ